MFLPLVPILSPRGASSSTNPPSASNIGPTLIIVSSVLGTALVFTLAAVATVVVGRKRRERRHFRAARLRDPNLTRDEYERRCRLSRSRILFEEELQRDNMIRKSLQSRTAVNKIDSPVRSPRRVRSRTWHGDGDIQAEANANGLWGETVLQALRNTGNWDEAEANVQQTWQILNGPRHPSGQADTALFNRQLQQDEANRLSPRPPTIRLKTPPILSHPAFRGLVRGVSGGKKKTSLPPELERAKAIPLF